MTEILSQPPKRYSRSFLPLTSGSHQLLLVHTYDWKYCRNAGLFPMQFTLTKPTRTVPMQYGNILSYGRITFFSRPDHIDCTLS